VVGAQACKKFQPDFVFLSKCLALDPETVAEIIRDLPNAMWYHDPQWYADLDRPDIAHIAAIGRLARTFFVTGFDSEWRDNGLPAKFLPAAGDAEIHPVTEDPKHAAHVTFMALGTTRNAPNSSSLSPDISTSECGAWDGSNGRTSSTGPAAQLKK